MDFNFQLIDLILISPLLVLFLASLLPLTIKVLVGREPNSIVTMSYGIIGVLGGLIGILMAQQGISKMAFERALVFDGLGIIVGVLVMISAGITLVISRENFSTNNNQYSEFVFLVLNAAIGMLTVLYSNDLITLFIGIELMSLPIYILVALSSEQRLSKEAAFKYFILGSFASAILLFGSAFIYGSVGSTYLPDITNNALSLMESNRIFMLGSVFLIVGLCFKVSIFPFHAWTPDVYQGAPTPITGFMATGVKAVCFAFFLRLMGTEGLMAERAESLVELMQWLAVMTMIAGNVAALMQSNLKRMLAYSSISHSGFILAGLIVAGSGGPNSFLGASSVGFYLVAYTLMTLGAFAVISMYETNEDTELSTEDLNGLAKRHPWMAASLSVFLLSLAGVPPMIGFFAKFFILSAAIKLGYFWLAIWAVLASILGVYFYLKPVVHMYMKPSANSEEFGSRPMTQVCILVSAALVILAGIGADPIFYEVVAAMKAIF